MSIYDNETTKIYPDLSPTAPQEPQSYCLNKLTEIEAFFLMKLKFVNKLPKKWNDSIQSQLSQTQA